MTTTKRKTCFVIMPYGEKKDAEGNPINFDDIFEYIIKPPLEAMKIEVIRGDKIPNAGSIHREMLHNILNEDLAIVDITTLNPNVFYELGIRHAMRRSGTILIRKQGTQNPFNIQGMRTIEYDISLSGAKIAIEKLRKSVEAALSSSASDSLVYDIFPNLKADIVDTIQHALPLLLAENPVESVENLFRRTVENATGRTLERRLSTVLEPAPALLVDLLNELKRLDNEMKVLGDSSLRANPRLRDRTWGLLQTLGNTLRDDSSNLDSVIELYELLTKLEGFNEKRRDVFYTLNSICAADPARQEEAQKYLKKAKELED